MRIASVLLPALLSISCGSSDTPPSPEESIRAYGGDMPKVAPDAVVEMKPKDWDDTYRKLGASAFARANRIQPEMAQLLSRRSECDSVVYLGISMEATRDNLQFYADCANGRRVRGSENELSTGG